jgi:hypothetical protein
MQCNHAAQHHADEYVVHESDLLKCAAKFKKIVVLFFQKHVTLAGYSTEMILQK